MPLPQLLDCGTPFEVHYSKTSAAFTLILVALIGGSMAWTGFLLLWLPVFWLVGLLSLGLTAVFVLPVGLRALRALGSRDAPLVFDDEGVTDTRRNPSFAAWRDIHQVTLGYGETAYLLRIDFREREVAARYISGPFSIGRIIRRLYARGDWNLDLWYLQGSRHELLRIALAYRSAGIRKRVVAARVEQPEGWTGPL